jgi:hypothetical protein
MHSSILKLTLISLATLFFTYSVESLESVKRKSLLNVSGATHDCICLYDNKTSNVSNHGFISELNNTDVTQGWTTQPGGRGTIDIIWQCSVTFFLCCWNALCLNVPSPSWGRRRRLHQKLLMACMGGLGPEFTFQLAIGQWSSARRSVEEFKRSGYSEWSMKHAFLADMGGFVLHPPDWVEFPLNAKQVHYLVTHNYIPYSAVCLDKRTIDDKNKVDGMVRFITVCQILWFSLNCMGRAIQHLAITTLELSALAFIFCTLGTYFFWAHKPMDVGSSIILEPNITIAEILVKAGDTAREQYRRTPLDFVGREHSSWYLYWTYWMNIVRKCHLVFEIKRGPIDKIPDDNFPPLSRVTLAILFLFQTTYAAIHLCGWNFYFPTHIERLLWRISTL